MGARAALGTLVLAATIAASAPAASFASDGAATAAYLTANLRLARTAASHIGAARAAIDGVLAHVRAQCPLAALDSPQDPQSTQLSNEVIGDMVISAIRTDLPALRAFVRATAPLRWSSAPLTHAVREYVSQVRAMGSLSPPDLCGDVRSWAASHFRALPASTLAFSPRFMENWVALGQVPAAMARFEGAPSRALARRASGSETQLAEFEAHEVETWGTIMNALVLSP